MSNPSSHRPSDLPEIHPYLCSQGIAKLRAACQTRAELESLEARLLLAGLVSGSDQTQDASGLVATDTSADQAAVNLDTLGLTDLSGVINMLASYDWSNPNLPARQGNYRDSSGVLHTYTSDTTNFEQRNQPIGNDSWYSIFPGRVVWVYDPAATHSAAGQTPWVSNTSTTGPFWWENTYTDPYEVDQMVAYGVMQLTGTTTVADAWDALFRAFNRSHGNGDVGYVAGEKITIKCNLNTETALGQTNNQKKNTPQVLSAVLEQLTNPTTGLGIAQEDISVYDDLKIWSTPYWDYYSSTNHNPGDPHLYSPQVRFPNVHWEDSWLGGGRHTSAMTATTDVSYPWNASSYIPQYVKDAKYAINMSVLSGHADAGCTFSAKNYVGSIGETPNDNPGQNQTIHGHRTPGTMGQNESVFTSFLVNADLGQKNILYMTDALYGGWSWGTDASTPTPWAMPPFGDGQVGGARGWPSSLLMSQDPIALDSVDMDFLMTESTVTGPAHNLGDMTTNGTYKNADDYLHESAQIGNPASGTNYLTYATAKNIPQYLIDQHAAASLGVHEHWNNAIDKQYSRNLGTGSGIELVYGVPGQALPSAPTNVVATVACSNEVHLTWTDTSAETGFKIERSTSDDFSTNLVLLGTTATNVHSFEDTTAVAGTTYYYRVRAVNWGQPSTHAASGPAVPHAVLPTAPTGLAAVAGGAGQVNLAWALGGTNDQGFKIERATDPGFTQNLTSLGTTGKHATGFSDTSALPATGYYYRVRATNADGDSGYSNSGSTATPPMAAGGLKAEFWDYNANLDAIPDMSSAPAITRTETGYLYNGTYYGVYYSSTSAVSPTGGGTNAVWTVGGTALPSEYADSFAARFTGYILIPTTGTYVFWLRSDDGSRMFLDGTPIIDMNHDQGMTDGSYTATNLSAGYHAVRIEYYEDGGGAGLIFSYTPPGGSRTVVPASMLYTGGTNVDPKWTLAANGHWENAANWDTGAVPTLGTTALLDGTPPANPPTLYQDQGMRGLDITTSGWTVNANGHTLTVGAAGLSLPGGSTPTSKIDLKAGNLVLDYAGSADNPLAAATAWIKAGTGAIDPKGRLLWNGTGGITSTAVQANRLLTGLGVRDTAFALGSSEPLTAVDGVAVDNTAVVIKYTYVGDANLDGVVDVNDYTLWMYFLLNPPDAADVTWMTGDFNYDGKIDVNDYALWTYGLLNQGGPLGGDVEPLAALPASEPAPAPGAAGTSSALLDELRASGLQPALVSGTTEAVVSAGETTPADLAAAQTDGDSAATSPLAIAPSPDNPTVLRV